MYAEKSIHRISNFGALFLISELSTKPLKPRNFGGEYFGGNVLLAVVCRLGRSSIRLPRPTVIRRGYSFSCNFKAPEKNRKKMIKIIVLSMHVLPIPRKEREILPHTLHTVKGRDK